MKKKITVISIVIIVLTLIVSGTLAYFKAEDKVKNVFTVGSIKIVQSEQEHDDQGNLVPFTQGQYMYPIVNVNNPSMDKHYVEKLVSVKNTGKNEAYVRSFIAIPSALKEIICLDVSTDGSWVKDAYNYSSVSIEGKEYSVVSYTYLNTLASNQESTYVLKGIYLDAKTDLQTNDEGEKQFCILGEDEKYRFYEFDVEDPIHVFVVSQACQVDGLNENPQVALQTVFGNETPAFQ